MVPQVVPRNISLRLAATSAPPAASLLPHQRRGAGSSIQCRLISTPDCISFGDGKTVCHGTAEGKHQKTSRTQRRVHKSSVPGRQTAVFTIIMANTPSEHTSRAAGLFTDSAPVTDL